MSGASPRDGPPQPSGDPSGLPTSGAIVPSGFQGRVVLGSAISGLPTDAGLDTPATHLTPTRPMATHPHLGPVASPGPAIAAAPPQEILPPGTRIAGRYEVLSALGRGGMGAVYRARDTVLDEEVAVKVLLPGVVGAPGMAERFLVEAKTALQLTHPGIVRVRSFDVDPSRGTAFIVMALVRGRSLRSLLRERGKLEGREAISLVTRVLEALVVAHAITVHRDLKPENIMVDEAGRPVILDFGLAKTIGPAAASGHTESGAVMGTYAYMAPEQKRDSANVDARADIFAVGAILFELLTGMIPAGSLPAPSALSPGLPPACDAVILRALALRPEDRYGSAQAFLDDLRAFEGGTQIVPPSKDAGRTAERRALAAEAAAHEARRAQPLLYAVLILAVAGVGLGLWAAFGRGAKGPTGPNGGSVGTSTGGGSYGGSPLLVGPSAGPSAPGPSTGPTGSPGSAPDAPREDRLPPSQLALLPPGVALPARVRPGPAPPPATTSADPLSPAHFALAGEQAWRRLLEERRPFAGLPTKALVEAFPAIRGEWVHASGVDRSVFYTDAHGVEYFGLEAGEEALLFTSAGYREREEWFFTEHGPYPLYDLEVLGTLVEVKRRRLTRNDEVLEQACPVIQVRYLWKPGHGALVPGPSGGTIVAGEEAYEAALQAQRAASAGAVPAEVAPEKLVEMVIRAAREKNRALFRSLFARTIASRRVADGLWTALRAGYRFDGADGGRELAQAPHPRVAMRGAIQSYAIGAPLVWRNFRGEEEALVEVTFTNMVGDAFKKEPVELVREGGVWRLGVHDEFRPAPSSGLPPPPADAPPDAVLARFVRCAMEDDRSLARTLVVPGKEDVAAAWLADWQQDLRRGLLEATVAETRPDPEATDRVLLVTAARVKREGLLGRRREVTLRKVNGVWKIEQGS